MDWPLPESSNYSDLHCDRGKRGGFASLTLWALALATTFFTASASLAGPCSPDPAVNNITGCGVGDASCECLEHVPNLAQCMPTGVIRDEFFQRGGCATFGAPVSRIRPRLSAAGSSFQEFERGEIALYSSWAGGGAMPDFRLSGARNGDRIHVWWGSTEPYEEYDTYLLRWDLDDNPDAVDRQHKPDTGFLEDVINLIPFFDLGDDKQQKEVEPDEDDATQGHADFDAVGGGTYVIVVEGCDDGITGLDCPDGWSHPIFVDNLDASPPLVPGLESDPNAVWNISFEFDRPDESKHTFEQRSRQLNAGCDKALLVRDDDPGHPGELEGMAALARLELARLLSFAASGPQVSPHVKKKCLSAPLLGDAVAAIEAAVRVSNPGTDLGMPLNRLSGGVGVLTGVLIGLTAAGALVLIVGATPLAAGSLVVIGGLLGGVASIDHGDYDMRMREYVRIATAYGADIGLKARDNLVNNLLIGGGESERRDLVHLRGVPLPIRETENHIWSTEASRHLTNNLIADDFKAKNLPVPAEFDNDANGMTEWILVGLRQFLIDDFYEFNSRPYATHTFTAIEALYDLAAMGSPPCSVLTPGPHASRCDVRRAARNVLDYVATKFALSSNGLRRSAPFRRQPVFEGSSRLYTTAGDDMMWRVFPYTAGSDYIIDQRHMRLPENTEGNMLATELSDYRPSLLVTDLIRSSALPARSTFQRFHGRARDTNTSEVYYREGTFLISAGGRHDDSAGLTDWVAWLLGGLADDSASALATTLIPTAEGGDLRDFVRIDGHRQQTDRHNLCVAPGFACGLNPAIPAGLPAACVVETGGWTFLDFDASDPACPDFGYFAVVRREPCLSERCTDHAGEGASIGFFSVSEWRPGFQSYITYVLNLNSSETYGFEQLSSFTSPNGEQVKFAINGDPDRWAIHAYGKTFAATLTVPERDYNLWPAAEGTIVNAPSEGCITIDNAKFGRRLVLDQIDALRPRRADIQQSMIGRCGCPLVDACLNDRAE